MSEFEGEIDQELRAEFIDESMEELDRVSGLMVELESRPDDKSLIGPIFRAVHSIKGNSAYFGALKTKDLAHRMESVLDLLRKDALAATGPVVDALLRGVDQLQGMLDRTREGEDEVTDPDRFQSLLDEVSSLAEEKKKDEETLWKEFFDRLEVIDDESLIELAEELADFYPTGRAALGRDDESEPDNSSGSPKSGTASAEIEMNPTTLNSAMNALRVAFGEQDSSATMEVVRNALSCIREKSSGEEAEKVVSEAMSDLNLFDGLLGLDDPVAQDAFDGHIKSIEKAIRDDLTQEEKQPQTDESPEYNETGQPSKEGAPTEKEQEKGGKATGKTMRIPEETIDVFLSYVGDLVTIGEMYSNLYTNLANDAGSRRAASELRRINESFEDLSQSLQSSIMEIRKVPMSVILRRVPRTVRKIASSENKKIDVSVEGENVMADKSIVNTLETPLNHMVRNAADHGIESPEQREECGKPPQGQVLVSAEETDDDIELSVKDDGAGLDYDALEEKAIELDFISPGQDLTEDDVLELLFQSGVSTADEVTDVSGRGVGMDVVRKKIDSMGGDVSVSSIPGEGTEFTVRLPKTVSTEIIDGFIVVVNDNRYVFPMQNIVRSFRPEPSDIETVQEKGECVKTNKGLIRICRLGQCFDHRKQYERDEAFQDSVLVVVETEIQPLAISVDEIEGVRQVVLKDIHGLVEDIPVFRGGAVMGDGSVAMIVDVDELADIDTLNPDGQSAV
ncbi:MAG: chemotaxis protein CheA [Candidatus Brocadiia bacterium]